MIGFTQANLAPPHYCTLTVRKKTKKIDPMNPPRMVIFPSVASSSLKSCIAAKVRIERAAEDTNEYGVGNASKNECS